ncbi:hypothetical protein O181_067879 [Austropuccinia psidii MF-1]|uniref:Uncharacterized protein n=1 Tax=Austropuccinia psidii MF-1 TaxID=1389203 RepID=A0A9Q3EVV0_9BASI|nr:hypothetical protein [Austropuccinia psidii MF-1]
MNLFSPPIQWHQFQMVISTFHQVIKAHHREDSSRFKEKSQSEIPMTLSRMIGYSHSQYSSKGILAVHSQGIFKRQLQTNFPSVSSPSIHLGNHIHSIQSGFIKTCISIINHAKESHASQSEITPGFPNCELPNHYADIFPKDREEIFSREEEAGKDQEVHESDSDSVGNGCGNNSYSEPTPMRNIWCNLRTMEQRKLVQST